MYPDCIISSIYGQMTFSNNYDLYRIYDTIRIHVQTYLKVSGLLIFQIIVFKKIMPSVKLLYNFI
jgi:hypothetical protein